MSKKDFAEYLKKQHLEADNKVEIDWDKEKDQWLNYLNQLYTKIEIFLKDHMESGDLSIERGEKLIHEELIGEYKVKTITLRFKDNKVTFDPIGTTNLIGAKGRVDMKGSAGIVKFVLVNKQAVGPRIKFTIQISSEPELEEKEQDDQNIEWDWKIATPPPRIEYIELNEESFFDSLMEVING